MSDVPLYDDEMSISTKVVCERGKFFIETGASDTFRKFVSNSANNVIKYVPVSVINRIYDLIDAGNRSDAITLWIKACEVAYYIPMRRNRQFVYAAAYLFLFAIALAALIRTF